MADLEDCSPVEMRRKIWRMWKMTPRDLQAMSETPGVCAGDMAIAAVLFSALTKGDHQKLEWLMSRLVGKIREELLPAGSDGGDEANQLPTIEEAKQILDRDYATLPAPAIKVEDL